MSNITPVDRHDELTPTVGANLATLAAADRRTSRALAQRDAFMADDLKFFLDIAKMGKAEIIADTTSDFCQEGR